MKIFCREDSGRYIVLFILTLLAVFGICTNSHGQTGVPSYIQLDSVLSVHTSDYFWSSQSKIESITFYPDSSGLEIVYSGGPNPFLVVYDSPDYSGPKIVWKDIYKVVGGKLIKIKKVNGVFKPRQVIEEQIIFDEGK